MTWTMMIEAFVGAFGGMLLFWACLKVIVWWTGEKTLLHLIAGTVAEACQRVHDANK